MAEAGYHEGRRKCRQPRRSHKALAADHRVSGGMVGDPGRSLREQLDLDSFGFLNLLVAPNERLYFEVPESDCGRVDSLDRPVGEARLARDQTGRT